MKRANNQCGCDVDVDLGCPEVVSERFGLPDTMPANTPSNLEKISFATNYAIAILKPTPAAVHGNGSSNPPVFRTGPGRFNR